MPQSLPLAYLSFKQQVAQQFANRPSLREVVASAGYDALVARYPWTRENHPELRSIAGFSILHSLDEELPAQQSNLVDTLLEHFLSGQPMALEPTDQLSLNPPTVFRPQHVAPAIDIRMADLNTDYDDVLATLCETFQQAQISYWNGRDGDSDVTRLQWMKQVLKAALLATLEHQGLDSDQKALLYTLLARSHTTVDVQALQVSLGNPGNVAHEGCRTCSSRAKKMRDLVLWCSPPVPCAVSTASAFAAALRDELSEHHAFDTMTWACAALTEDRSPIRPGNCSTACCKRLTGCSLALSNMLLIWSAYSAS
jgi:hypothetical protein